LPYLRTADCQLRQHTTRPQLNSHYTNGFSFECSPSVRTHGLINITSTREGLSFSRLGLRGCIINRSSTLSMAYNRAFNPDALPA